MGVKIGLVPVGVVDGKQFNPLVQGLHKLQEWEAVVAEAIDSPAYAYLRERQQYHSTVILRRLKTHYFERGVSGAARCDKLVGVTEVDMCLPALSFVFGQAEISGPVAVVSLARLRQEYYGLPADEGLLRQRLIKEVVHELGHTFGLEHCSRRSCVMYYSNTIDDTDLKSNTYCSTCVNDRRLVA